MTAEIDTPGKRGEDRRWSNKLIDDSCPMHIDDWMIARLLGHKTLQSVHHYRKIGNKIMADETRAVREKIDMILMDVVKEWDGYEI